MIARKRILIVDDMHEIILPFLRDAGYEPVYLPVIDRVGILKIIPEFEGLIVRNKTSIDKEIIDLAMNLKFVVRAGAGMDNIDQPYLESKKIKVINTPEGNRDALGEHTLGLLLSLLHKIPSSFEEIKRGIWDREGNRGIELMGKIVGIYGVGNMGFSFASKLSALGCEIIGYDKYRENFSNRFIREVGLNELMEKTEILSIHIPLSYETRGLFCESYFRKFKKLKIFINMARGEILDTHALIKLLEDGTLYGAGLDVLKNEQLTSYSEEEKNQLKHLSSLPNVLITPHVGGWTFESFWRISKVIVDKIRKEL